MCHASASRLFLCIMLWCPADTTGPRIPCRLVWFSGPSGLYFFEKDFHTQERSKKVSPVQGRDSLQIFSFFLKFGTKEIISLQKKSRFQRSRETCSIRKTTKERYLNGSAGTQTRAEREQLSFPFLTEIVYKA